MQKCWAENWTRFLRTSREPECRRQPKQRPYCATQSELCSARFSRLHRNPHRCSLAEHGPPHDMLSTRLTRRLRDPISMRPKPLSPVPRPGLWPPRVSGRQPRLSPHRPRLQARRCPRHPRLLARIYPPWACRRWQRPRRLRHMTAPIPTPLLMRPPPQRPPCLRWAVCGRWCGLPSRVTFQLAMPWWLRCTPPTSRLCGCCSSSGRHVSLR